jgi:4-hydroxythreonine-4-phosphate dehydrogenase
MEKRSRPGNAVEPLVAISIGCPSGIGPEVAVRAAAEASEARSLLVGDGWVVERAAALVGVARRRLVAVEDPRRASAELARRPGAIGWYAPPEARRLARKDAAFGRPGSRGGEAQLAWIDAATRLVTSGVARALVTGPVSKHAIASSPGRAAAAFRGHTEHLARMLRAREVVMAFFSDELTMALVTTHVPLRRVPGALRPELVASAIFHVAQLVARLGRARPRIVVAALNPHAGEQGLLGDEERTRIEPGIAAARRRLARARLVARVEGPIGAETAIRKAHGGEYDAVVAMYHDQATIPLKLLGFGEAVNVTLGLPIIRTSVDHGTGYDLAGHGKADPRGMRAAIALAVRLVGGAS